MTRLALVLVTLLFACGLLYCTREDGLPDPPAQQLVPCDPDAGQSDPLACPIAPVDSDASPPDAGAELGADA